MANPSHLDGRKYKKVSSDGLEQFVRTRIGEEFESLCAKAGYTPENVTYATEYANGTVGVLIPCDSGLNIPNLWRKQALKVDKDGNKQIKYYQTTSDNTDLPYNGTGWENGVITERYLFQEINGDDLVPLGSIDASLQEKLTAFASTHGLDLPDHDMSDTNIMCVSVDYTGDSPTNIDFHIIL